MSGNFVHHGSKAVYLESGALDHSAILTLVKSDRVLAEINLALWDGAIGSTWKKKVGIP